MNKEYETVYSLNYGDRFHAMLLRLAQKMSLGAEDSTIEIWRKGVTLFSIWRDGMEQNKRLAVVDREEEKVKFVFQPKWLHRNLTKEPVTHRLLVKCDSTFDWNVRILMSVFGLQSRSALLRTSATLLNKIFSFQERGADPALIYHNGKIANRIIL